jgi:hypothetical protein
MPEADIEKVLAALGEAQNLSEHVLDVTTRSIHAGEQLVQSHALLLDAAVSLNAIFSDKPRPKGN